MKWLCVILCAGMVTAWAAADQADDAALPAEYRAFVEQCAKYNQLRMAKSWESVFVRNPAAGDVSTQLLSLATADAKLEAGDHVLRLIAAENRPALLKVGAPVSGDFVVEYEARITGERLYHISVVVDQRNQGPGFVFGGDDNRRNRLFTDASSDHTGGGSIELNPTPLIERNRWYTVRMEVQGGQVRGYVDGKMLGAAPLKNYDPAKPRQLMLYTYGTTMEIRRITVQVLLGKPTDDAQAFAKAFGDMTRQQFDRRIADLIQRLDADAWTTRQQAQQVLGQIGSLAKPALEEAAKNGSAEQRFRARQILGISEEKSADTGPGEEVEQTRMIFD